MSTAVTSTKDDELDLIQRLYAACNDDNVAHHILSMLNGQCNHALATGSNGKPECSAEKALRGHQKKLARVVALLEAKVSPKKVVSMLKGEQPVKPKRQKK